MIRRASVLVFFTLLVGDQLLAQQHINQRKGFNAENTYQFLGIDNVNLFNGNLTLTIPIGQTYEVGGGLSYGLQLACNGNVWDSEVAEGEHCCDEDPEAIPYKALPDRRSNAGLGCLVTLGRLLPPQTVTNDSPWWVYESPDGAEHYFHPTMQAGQFDDHLDDGFTRDGTYLRTRTGGGGRFVDFPDGTVHEFEADPNSIIGAWRLKRVANQYPGNELSIAYPTANLWQLTDSLGRSHEVEFQPRLTDGTWIPMVKEVRLDAFGALSPATYAFTYTKTHPDDLPLADPVMTIVRPQWDTDDHVTGTPRLTAIPLVTTLTLPDSTKFQIEHILNGEANGSSGLPFRLRLPTQGCIAWRWGTYGKPVESGSSLHVQGSHGVDRRVLSDRSCPNPYMSDLNALKQLAIGVWTYDPQLNWDLPLGFIPREMTQRVTDPLGHYVVHYFSALPVNLDGWLAADYGLPFTRNVYDSAGRPLSRRTYGANNQLLRSEHVTYERDGAAGGLNNEDKQNVRVASTRTIYDDDGQKFVDSTSTNYDGLGHHRVTTASGGTLTPGFLRTTTTNYNCPSPAPCVGAGTAPGYLSPWLLNTFKYVEVGEGDERQRSEVCFDDKGFMTRKRSLKNLDGARGANDVIGVFTADPVTGNMATETWHGGDTASVSQLDTWCSAGLGTPAARLNYNINFLYQGVLKSTAEYLDAQTSATLGFFTTDLTLDRSTGLVESSRDSSGAETSYEYDALGRPTKEKPAGRAWTTFNYDPATTSATAKVTVKQYPNGFSSGTALTTATYHFDDLGRLVRALRDMPGTTSDSEQRFEYNALGWKTFVSEPGAPGSPAGTTFTHDRFGRPLSVLTADGNTSSVIYTGTREKKRRSWLAVPPTGVQEVEVKETYDAAGRLVDVVEKSGPTQASAATGADVKTEYKYDVADRLRSVRMLGAEGVAQNRYFDYDGRGFLRWEAHPESGMAAYVYDARGRVSSKTQSEAGSPFDLKYFYDSAERLTRIDGRNPLFDPANPAQPAFRPMKEFTYWSSNGPSPDHRRRGKLETATRYNYPDFFHLWELLYKVSETYFYRDDAGRKTDRRTTVEISTEPNGPFTTHQEIDTRIEHNDLDLPSLIEYPMCYYCGTPPVGDPRRLIEPQYEQGRLKSVTGFVSDVTYWPNGMWNVMSHTNGMADTQIVDGSGMTRPASISFAPHDSCSPPVIDSQPGGGSITSTNTSVPLTVVASGSPTYQWFTAPDRLPIYGATEAIYVATPSVTTDYYVEVTNSCRMVTSHTATVAMNACPLPSISAIQKVKNADGTWTLTPQDVKARDPREFFWRRDSDQALMGQQESLTVIVAEPTSYTLTVDDECGIGTATATVQPALPLNTTGLQANYTAGQMVVTWPAAPGATSYRLERRSGWEWEYLADVAATSHVDGTVAANRTYAYRVLIFDSVYSNADVATTKVLPTVAQSVVVTPAPFDEMLATVNLVRAAAGWTPVTWNNILAATDPVPLPQKRIMATHVSSCRARMNEALQALGAPISPYDDPDLKVVSVKASHINQIHNRAK